MVVKLKYLSPGKKEFVIQSATGSKLIIDKVLKRLLDAEEEELAPEIQRRSALTEDNYHFKLIGHESRLSGDGTYVLQVEPRRKDKFLYQGQIWVDASDFAVLRLEAEPTKNPSFWTRKSNIVQVYTKASDFWLPGYNDSSTAIRLGGHAHLTIAYKDYEITDASKVSALAAPRAIPQVETTHAQQQ
jgi:MucB/RseB N-terminal domain